MSKPIIAVTGGNGLVGSQFISNFSEQYQFLQLDISDPVSPVDITQPTQVMAALENKPITAIVHFAAYTDVTGAWKQSGDTNGIAYKVNVTGTQVMLDAANQLGCHLVHISTAYVFDGTNEQLYTEEDKPNPIEWYGTTKLLAEEAVQNSANNWSILRIDQPFRRDPFAKPDALHRILAGLHTNTLYPQFSDHWFGPTYIPDFAKTIQLIIDTKTTGLYHASSGEMWSDFEFAQAVATTNGFDPELVKKGSLAEYLKTTERPYQKNTALSTEKLEHVLEIPRTSVADALHITQ